MPIFDPAIFDPAIFDTGAPAATGITVAIVAQDVSTSLSWRSWTITESIGQPDTLSCEINELDTAVHDLLGSIDNYYYIHVRKNGALLFSGVTTKLLRRNDHGRVTYTLQAVGWEFLAPKRLVGVPGGFSFYIQEDDDPARLPTGIANDPSAENVSPGVSAVQALFAAYWAPPPLIDTVTYVTEILPEGVTADEITFSGTDLDGVMNDLCAAGSAAAMWWIANDSPDAQSDIAPHLALHFGLNSLPGEGDDGGELALGLGAGDEPTNIAPYSISDTPDFVTSIMASATPELEADYSQRAGAVYVRGATGFTLEVLPSPPGWPFPYVLGETIKGGTGWVGSPGGIWGDAYVDAPAAVTPAQRDAFGSAYLEAHGRASISGTILVEGYDGWHKGQAVQVTDAGLGLDERWLLIRSVSIKANDPYGEALSYGLTVGDTLTAQLGYTLRQQRLKEARKEIAPATRFIPYVGDLLLAPTETSPLTFQLATDAGKAMPVAGVGAVWHLLLNGADVPDVEDTGGAFYLTDLILVTDEKGQVTATLHAGASALASDAVRPWVAMVP